NSCKPHDSMLRCAPTGRVETMANGVLRLAAGKNWTVAMASITLDRDRLRAKDLPACCLRCGEPATLNKDRNFSWCPPWVGVLILAGLLPYLIVSLILTKRARVAVPLCAAHANHWRWREWVIWGSFLFLGILFFAVLVLISGNQNQGLARDIGGFA